MSSILQKALNPVKNIHDSPIHILQVCERNKFGIFKLYAALDSNVELEYLQKAFAIDPTDFSLGIKISDLFLQIGNLERAYEYLRKFDGKSLTKSEEVSLFSKSCKILDLYGMHELSSKLSISNSITTKPVIRDENNSPILFKTTNWNLIVDPTEIPVYPSTTLSQFTESILQLSVKYHAYLYFN